MWVKLARQQTKGAIGEKMSSSYMFDPALEMKVLP
jgi:hypothetical protein